MNIYTACSAIDTAHFTLRLVRAEDAPGPFRIYPDYDQKTCKEET